METMGRFELTLFMKILHVALTFSAYASQNVIYSLLFSGNSNG